MEQAGSVAARLGGGLVDAATVDVGAARERARRGRLRTLGVVLALPATFLWYRILTGAPFDVFALPAMPADPIIYVLPVMIVLSLAAVVAMPLASGRSPDMSFRPEQIDVTLDDVKGLGPVVDEVVKTLNTFLGHGLYRDRLGGTPRRGLLFEGLPGTGKTHLAKAMAREAGVPFLFVSATSFQSMWYGATARKIRSYFKKLRRVAAREGGVIGFIEEIDAIATARGGMRNGADATHGPARATMIDAFGGASESTGGVVNELLVQMQSFDTPPLGDRLVNAAVDILNAYLTPARQLPRRPPRYANILLVAATNRAADLDPALLRPGRFDRRLTFELPAQAARRELVDHFLARKAHASELDDDGLRERLATQTFGSSPVQIEHLLDEALVVALRAGRDAMNWADVAQARLVGEIGLATPVVYSPAERRTVATHEAGHATVAFLVGGRRLEVLSIVKRAGSLGLLAHGDIEEVYTRTRGELCDLIDIALGGRVAEEVLCGQPGSGPASDLAQATRLACELVGSLGMGDSLVSLAAVQHGSLTATNLVGCVLGDARARPQVERVLTDAHDRVVGLIQANRHIVEALRDALLLRDELIGADITAVIRAAGAPVPADLRVERHSSDSAGGGRIDAE